MKTKEELNEMTKEELISLYEGVATDLAIYKSLYESEEKAHEALNSAISAISGVINLVKKD